MSTRRSAEDALAAKTTTIREQATELGRLRRLLEAAETAIEEARSEVALNRELVRFVLRDTVVDDLRVEVRPGSGYDLSMMELLVDVAREDALDEAIVASWRDRGIGRRVTPGALVPTMIASPGIVHVDGVPTLAAGIESRSPWDAAGPRNEVAVGDGTVG